MIEHITSDTLLLRFFIDLITFFKLHLFRDIIINITRSPRPTYIRMIESGSENYLVSVVVVLGLEGSALHLSTVRSSHGGGLFASAVIDFDKVFNGFAIRQGTKAFGLNGCLMDEHITAPIIWYDEAKTLHCVEPLYSSLLDSFGGFREQDRARPKRGGAVGGKG